MNWAVWNAVGEAGNVETLRVYGRSVCGLGRAALSPAVAQGLYAQLFPLTGEVRLLNRNETAVPFVFYSIASDSGALNPSTRFGNRSPRITIAQAARRRATD